MSPGSPAARQRSSSAGLLLETRNDSTISPASRETSVGAGTMSTRPVSSLEKSRRSLTSRRSVFVLTSMESTACSRSASVLAPIFSTCEKPTMAFRGVRMSWLTVEKK